MAVSKKDADLFELLLDPTMVVGGGFETGSSGVAKLLSKLLSKFKKAPPKNTAKTLEEVLESIEKNTVRDAGIPDSVFESRAGTSLFMEPLSGGKGRRTKEFVERARSESLAEIMLALGDSRKTTIRKGSQRLQNPLQELGALMAELEARSGVPADAVGIDPLKLFNTLELSPQQFDEIVDTGSLLDELEFLLVEKAFMGKNQPLAANTLDKLMEATAGKAEALTRDEIVEIALSAAKNAGKN
jgi:hypothetical protein